MRKKWKNVVAVLAAMTMAAAMMAGCGNAADSSTSGEQSSSSAGGEEKSSGKGESSASNANDGEALKVCWIPICTGIDYFTPIEEGIEAACKELNIEFSTVAPDVADATSQIPYIESQIQNGVDILLIAPNSTDALNATLQDAKDAGVTVLMVNDDITGNEQYRAGCVIGCNYDELAEVMFDKLAQDMNYEGQYVIISSTTDAPFQNNQIAIYEELNKQDKYKNMELVEIMYGNDEQNASLSCAETAMDKYPELKGMLCPTTVAVVAAAQAVSQRGVYETVHVQGCGTPNQNRDFVKDGVMSSTTLWNTYMEGYAGVLLGYMIRNGEVNPETDASFEYDGTTYEFGPNATLYAGPPLDLTVDTIDEYDF